mmetsp:Transcript_26522/g.80008  ORF Transcript_26522/g.80008 Transcript_26522/m.80008 type:complete len:591 (+) Transcript_26522:135-1907(+)
MWHLRIVPGDLLTVRRIIWQPRLLAKSWRQTRSLSAVLVNCSSVTDACSRHIARNVCLPAVRQGVAVSALVEGGLCTFMRMEKTRQDRVAEVTCSLSNRFRLPGLSLTRCIKSWNIMSELIDFGMMFASHEAAGVPGLLVTGEIHSISDFIAQLRCADICTAYCDAQIALDDALFIQEAHLDDTFSWMRALGIPSWDSQCHYLHGFIRLTATTNGLVVIDNFGAVIRAAQMISGKKTPRIPHDCLPRAGAALRLIITIHELFQLDNKLCKPAGILVVSDEPIGRCDSGDTKSTALLSFSLLKSWYFEGIIRMFAIDKTTRAAVYAKRLKEVNLDPSRNVWELALKFALATAGFTKADINNAVDTTILRAAAYAHREQCALPLQWSDATVPHGSLSYVFDATAAWQGKLSTLRWHGVGGCHIAKYELEKAIVWPQTRKAQFVHFNLNTCRGVLLYGPPGNGKTMLARAVANETEAAFIAVQSGEVLKPHLGESETVIRQLFEQARQSMPCVMYFDEFDAIGHARGDAPQTNGSTLHARIIATLLDELDGLYIRDGNLVCTGVRLHGQVDSRYTFALTCPTQRNVPKFSISL